MSNNKHLLTYLLTYIVSTLQGQIDILAVWKSELRMCHWWTFLPWPVEYNNSQYKRYANCYR